MRVNGVFQTPPPFLNADVAAILEDLAIFKFSWMNSFEEINDLGPMNINFTDTITLAKLPVNFGNGLTGITRPLMSLGLGTSNTLAAPTYISVPKILDIGYYTLIMQDADAGSAGQRIKSPIMHWGVGNILITASGGNYTIIDTNTVGSTVLFPYYPPGSSVNSGPHRYVFLLYKQNQFEPFTGFPVYVSTSSAAGRAYYYMNRFFGLYYLSKPKLIALNWFSELDSDPNRGLYPAQAAEGTATVNGTGSITAVSIFYPVFAGSSGAYPPLSTFPITITQIGNVAGTGAIASVTTDVRGVISIMTLTANGSGYTGSSFVFLLPTPPVYAAIL